MQIVQKKAVPLGMMSPLIFIRKIEDPIVIGWNNDQCTLNNRQHQRSIEARAIASTVSRIRRGISAPSFTDAGVEAAVKVGFEAWVRVATGVGNRRLPQTMCVPVVGAGTGGVFPVPWLEEETVGTASEAVLPVPMVGVFVICQELEPSGIRAND